MSKRGKIDRIVVQHAESSVKWVKSLGLFSVPNRCHHYIPERTTMKAQIPNACSIVAMRELLDDPTWGTEEYARMILENDGLRSEDTMMLEQLAPVKVWYGGGLTGDESSAEIYNDSCRQELSPDEKITISYYTTEGRMHMECIRVKDIGLYGDKRIGGIITRCGT